MMDGPSLWSLLDVPLERTEPTDEEQHHAAADETPTDLRLDRDGSPMDHIVCQLNGLMSHSQPLLYGVPQKSVFGLLLFVLYRPIRV